MTREEALNTVRNIYQTDKEKEALATLIPELRESEDERIMKNIRLALLSVDDAFWATHGLTAKEAIEQLEKQKEKTENAKKTLAKILEDSAEGFRRILKKKGIDYKVSDGFWENTAGAYSKEEDVEFHKWMDDLMGPTPIEETCEYKKGFEAGMKQKEQKPAEWSEEDIDKMVSERARKSGTTKTEMNFYRQGIEDTLKFLRPQPKKSEYITSHKEFFKWIYDRLVNVHKENPNADYMISFKKRIEELSFDESHWKPSEEQMGALQAVINDPNNAGSLTCQIGLQDLLNCLEKL